MRLLFLLEGREVGGNETLLASLFPYLANHGFSPLLTTPKGKARQFLMPFVLESYDIPSEQSAWNTLIKSSNPDLCIAVHGDLPSFFAASKRSRKPTLWMYGHPFGLSHWAKPEVDLMSLLTDQVVAQSHYLANSLPSDRFKATVIPNGADLKKFSPVLKQEKENTRLKLKVSSKAFLLGYPARGAAYKGHSELLQRFESWKKDIPHLQLLLLGVEGIKKEGVHSIKVAPHEMREYLGAIDLALFPSKEEGYGCALAECLVMGIPSLIEKSGGHREFIDIGEEFFFEGNPTPKLLKLLTDQQTLKKLSQKALGYRENLDREKFLKQYAKLFNSLKVHRRETNPYHHPASL